MLRRLSAPFAVPALLLAAATTGCATPDDPAATAAPRAAPEYRTGSNIPVKEKERARPLTAEERERQADELRRIQATQGGMSSGRPGSSP